MQYTKREYQIQHIIREIESRKIELDPEISEQQDLINELERMQDDLTRAIDRIEKLNSLEKLI